jgi:hypothetical protein
MPIKGKDAISRCQSKCGSKIAASEITIKESIRQQHIRRREYLKSRASLLEIFWRIFKQLLAYLVFATMKCRYLTFTPSSKSPLSQCICGSTTHKRIETEKNSTNSKSQREEQGRRERNRKIKDHLFFLSLSL